MSDFYTNFANSNVGRAILSAINLPVPQVLDRYQPGEAFFSGNIAVGGSAASTVIPTVVSALQDAKAEVYMLAGSAGNEVIKGSAGSDKLSISEYTPSKEDNQKFKGIVFDASGVANTEELKEVYQFLHPIIRKLQACARVVIIGTQPELCETKEKATAQRALEGFARSVAKEIKRGATCQLIYVAPGSEANAESPIRFFLSPKSAYVSAQVVRVNAGDEQSINWDKPLAGKNALVTGGSRGIGEAIAKTLARDGAHVVVLDIEPMQEDLQRVASDINGDFLVGDVTADEAADKIAEKLKPMGGLDVLVHNAGVTRDKTLGGMPEHMWDMVMNINLISEEKMNDKLLAAGALNPNARIVCVSSMSGIAGNFGQTNYAMSKAGVIGMVQSTAQELKDGMTINAVAPGFIETQMTAAIPFTIREAGRRMNSMSQGGQPVDVAEAIAFFASPASSGVNGNVIRVCGQSLLGA